MPRRYLRKKCGRCHRRAAQRDGRCLACENAIIAEQDRIAKQSPPGPSPSYARPGGFGVHTPAPGMIGLSFFGIVHNRR